MLFSKMDSVRPLLESQGGLHLSVYLSPRGQADVSELHRQLNEAIEKAAQHLESVLSPDLLQEFLAPLKHLGKDLETLCGVKQSLGIFRAAKFFRVIRIPIRVERSSIVADTFHVKPLLKWIQLDREFLLLGFESGSVTLYQGDLQTLRPVDTVLFSPGVESSCSGSSLGGLNEWRDRKMRIQSTLEWLNGWILSLTLEVRPRLFLAGPQELTRKCLQIFQYENLASHAVSDTYSQQELSKLGTKVRVQLRAEARKSYRRRLAEFSDALSVRQASGNIFAIAQAAALGNVRKLLVADGIQLFGKLNRSSGSLQLHGGDLDHEDDDVLDDLAQLVLNRGGEVTVAARAEIPSGSAIQAILDEPDRHGYATVRARPGLTHVRFERSAS